MEVYQFKKYKKEELDNNYIKALKDENFKKVVNSLDIDEDIKKKYTSHLLEISKEFDICTNCKGLDSCPYDIKGLYEYPIVEDNIIKFVYAKCKYKIKQDKELEYLKNIKFYKMPSELMKASLKKVYKDDSNRLEAIKKIKEFYDNYLDNKKTKGLYLNGNFGSGKSYLISALFNELAKKGIKSTIIYYPELLRSLKASFGSEVDEYNERFDEIKNTPLLLIDDIGAEKVTEWSRDEVLGNILQYRMESDLKTFFTSNLSIEELEDHLSVTNNSSDKVKARRIIERIKYITTEVKMIGVNRRK